MSRKKTIIHSFPIGRVVVTASLVDDSEPTAEDLNRAIVGCDHLAADIEAKLKNDFGIESPSPARMVSED